MPAFPVSSVQYCNDAGAIIVAKKWYIVHVYSGFENKVKASLEEKIASSPNPDKFDEVLVPTEESYNFV